MVVDPHDRKNAIIKKGSFGDTVFARRDLKKGDIIMYYSGMLYENKDINWGNFTEQEK